MVHLFFYSISSCVKPFFLSFSPGILFYCTLYKFATACCLAAAAVVCSSPVATRTITPPTVACVVLVTAVGTRGGLGIGEGSDTCSNKPVVTVVVLDVVSWWWAMLLTPGRSGLFV